MNVYHHQSTEARQKQQQILSDLQKHELLRESGHHERRRQARHRLSKIVSLSLTTIASLFVK